MSEAAAEYRVVKSVTDGDGEHLAGELIALDPSTAALLREMGEVVPIEAQAGAELERQKPVKGKR